jgi:hypothetical protein
MAAKEQAKPLVRDGVVSSDRETRLSLATASNLKVASSRRGSGTPFREVLLVPYARGTESYLCVPLDAK